MTLHWSPYSGRLFEACVGLEESQAACVSDRIIQWAFLCWDSTASALSPYGVAGSLSPLAPCSLPFPVGRS